MTKQYTAKEIKQIIDENKRLHEENSSMKKALNSKRFKFADKIGNIYNQAFPEHSKRRNMLKTAYYPIRKISNFRQSRYARLLQNAIDKHGKVLVMHSIPWNTPLKQRPHHLAQCLAQEDFLVIYLEPDEAINQFRKISSNFFTINSWGTLFNLELNKQQKNYFVFNNVSDIPLDIIKKIDKQGFSLIYEYIDEFHEDIAGSIANQLAVWDYLPKLKPVLVLASAQKLYNEAKKHFTKSNVLLSKNAVNVADFDYHNFVDTPTPSDLAPILENGQPIVGYYGALAPWLDYDLITQTAKSNPKTSFVLIGVNYQNALNKLDTSIQNIYYLGPKKYTDLPRYSRFFDCAIIPFKTGRIAKGTSPVKLFEYMAMGIPVVGTKDLKECEGYDHVYLAQNYDEFSEYIKQGISEHHKEATRENLLAQSKDNSWQSRAQDIKKTLLKGKNEKNY